MSNIISIWGSPCSGKTTVSIKLATEIYNKFRGEKRVCVVFSDSSVPVVPYALQNENTAKISSIGSVLSSDDINDELICKALVTVNDMNNIGFIGYSHGENINSYPKLVEQNVRKLFELMSLLFDVIIVDVESVPCSLLSTVSLSLARKVITVINPEIKSLSWFDSNMQIRSSTGIQRKNINVLNHIDNYLFYPNSEIALLLGGIKYEIPFSLAIRQNGMDGNLIHGKDDKNYSDVLKRMVKDFEREDLL